MSSVCFGAHQHLTPSEHCGCDDGYGWNNTGTACVPTLVCLDAHKHWDNAAQACACDAGYTLDPVTQDCVVAPPPAPVPPPPVPVCEPGYVHDAAGRCVPVPSPGVVSHDNIVLLVAMCIGCVALVIGFAVLFMMHIPRHASDGDTQPQHAGDNSPYPAVVLSLDGRRAVGYAVSS